MSERMWMVRAGEGARLIEEFKKKKIVAVGWPQLGAETVKKHSRAELETLVEQKIPNLKKKQIQMSASQIYKFINEFKIEDNVISYNPSDRKYLVGKLKSGHKYSRDFCAEDYGNYREVEWLGAVDRDQLTTTTRNALGAISTLFEVKDPAKQEILNLLKGEKPVIEEAEAEDLDSIREGMLERSHEFIKDKVMDLDWDEMQELVAGVLRAMSFKTRVSKPGADRGKDIIASPDGLGLIEPKIIVEVKHRQGQMGRGEISSFLGGLRSGSKGLYVSTGGFSKEAHYEAERSNNPVTLIDADELVRLMIQYYDNFDSQARALVPLTKLYWPAWD